MTVPAIPGTPPYSVSNRRPIIVPPGFQAAWGGDNPLAIVLNDYHGLRRSFGEININARAFSSYLACLAGPAIYVSNAGSSSGAGTGASPTNSIWKAQQLLNATGQSGVIYVAAGSYNKDGNFCAGAYANGPTVDTLYMATGGRAVVGTWPAALAWAADSTYSWCWTVTRSSVARVFNRQMPDLVTGLMREYVKVSSKLICSVLPGSFYTDGTNLTVNPFAGETVSDTSVRVYLQVGNLQCSGASGVPVNVFLVGQNPNDGFDLEGGTGGGCWVAGYTAPAAAEKIHFAERCTFRYPGIYGDTSLANAVGIDSLFGLAFLSNCDGGGTKSDIYNLHNANDVGLCRMLTLNCSGTLAGAPLSTSNNIITAHENTVIADVGGHGRFAAGCSAHIINTSKGFLAGTTLDGSRGDQIYGGVFPPTEVRTSDSAEMWCDSLRILSPSGTLGFSASGTSKIHKRNIGTYAGADLAASGTTIDAY